MGVPTTNESVPDPLESGDYWTPTNPRLLRPGWKEWQDNQGWQDELTHKVKTLGHGLYSPDQNFPIQQYMDNVPEVAIRYAIRRYWITLSTKWKLEQKSIEEVKASAAAKRRRARTNNVSH